MAITHKEIAEIVGVSRGTVDRAIHDRGRVNPDIKRQILKVAAEHSYAPNRAGRALALAKNPIRIGVVVHLSRLPFFRGVLAGIEHAKAELAELGCEVLVAELPTLDAAAQIAAVDRLVAQGIQGLAISPAEDDTVRVHLEKLSIPLVTFNTDLPVPRLCFVGMDNARAGQTAAGLMHLMLGRQGGKVLIVSGLITNQANARRVDGFVQEVSRRYSDLRVPGIHFCADDDGTALHVVSAALHADPDLAGIYMVSGGQSGVTKALEVAGRTNIRLIFHDLLPETVSALQSGVADFVIDQNAFAQGSLPLRMLFDNIFDGRLPANSLLYTDISIHTLHNL